jgi:hypothetical protein
VDTKIDIFTFPIMKISSNQKIYVDGLLPGLQTEGLKPNGKGNGNRKKQLRSGKIKVYAPIAVENAVSGMVDAKNVVVDDAFLETSGVIHDPSTTEAR